MKYGIPLLLILQAASVAEAASLGYKLIEDTMREMPVSELLANFSTDHAQDVIQTSVTMSSLHQ